MSGRPLLLQVRGLRKSFPIRGRRERLHALAGIDFHLEEGECVAVVGESGSGKSTFGRCLTRLQEPDAGEIFFAGENVLALNGGKWRTRRREIQLVFQNAAAAFDPRMKIGRALEEARPEESVGDLLRSVGLEASFGGRLPHELSGGQRQRANIARALATRPRLLILDEPVSALDVTTQARILELLTELRQHRNLTLILITHDLAVAARLAERIAVFHQGKIVEEGAVGHVLKHPEHAQTLALLDAIPRILPSGKQASRKEID